MEERASSICLCVLMNHPFPSILPVLRRLYKERFAHVLFLVPFDRRPDEPDVITVYRGSYCHYGYIADALPRLIQEECTHFLFVHDDVLLNPSLDDSSFFDVFPLGAGEGFFPDCFRVTSFPIGGWSWAFNYVPQLTFPKSLMFGSGIERQNLLKYLPPAALVKEKLKDFGGIDEPLNVRFGGSMHDAGSIPSRVLFHGLYEEVQDSEEHAASSLAIEALIKAAAEAVRVARDRGYDIAGEGDSVELPFPLVMGGFLADFYIVPKTCLPDYAHYAGVASAAHLMVEFFAPTLLYAACENVLRARDLDLNFSGFNAPLEFDRFKDPTYIALHPYKLSTVRSAETQDDFIAKLHKLRGETQQALKRGSGAFPLASIDPVFAVGSWHVAENFGRWQAAASATISFELNDVQYDLLSALDMILICPASDAVPVTGSVYLNGISQPFEASTNNQRQRMQFRDRSAFLLGMNVIEIAISQLVEHSSIWAGSGDGRHVGVGLSQIEFLSLEAARSELVTDADISDSNPANVDDHYLR